MSQITKQGWELAKSATFSCPFNCMAAIGEVWMGTYAFGMEFKKQPRVLDIGANCGAFAIWACVNWRAEKVACFEPVPEVFGHLKANTIEIKEIEVFNAAVGDPALDHINIYGSGVCSSQYEDLHKDCEVFDRIKIDVWKPEDLPSFDMVKIDCEGAEAYIIERLQFVPAYIAVEYHSSENRRRIETALKGKMELVDLKCHHSVTGVGVMKFFKP